MDTRERQHGSKLRPVKEAINRALVVDWNRAGIIRKKSQVIGTNMWLTISIISKLSLSVFVELPIYPTS